MPMWAQRSVLVWDDTTNKRLENIAKFYTNNAIKYSTNKTDIGIKSRIIETKI
jgi:hypothetical protein